MPILLPKSILRGCLLLSTVKMKIVLIRKRHIKSKSSIIDENFPRHDDLEKCCIQQELITFIADIFSWRVINVGFELKRYTLERSLGGAGEENRCLQNVGTDKELSKF